MQCRLGAHAATRGHIVGASVSQAGAGVDEDDVERLQRIADALELFVDIGGGCDIPVGKMPEVELYAGLEAPLERHFVDRSGALPFVHRRMVVPGRVEMSAVVSRERHAFNPPSLPVRQVLLSEARKERQDLRQTLLVINVRDLGAEPGRIRRDIVLQRRGNVDEASSHASLLPLLARPRRRYQPLRVPRRALRSTLATSAAGKARVNNRPTSQPGTTPESANALTRATTERMIAARSSSSTNRPNNCLTTAPIMRARLLLA